MNGILLIDKPAGLTSADVVRRVKHDLRGKVGHLGTLDPFATGLLPLCLGEATKIAQFLNTADKRYEGIIQLGTATDTGDCTGQPVRETGVPDLAGIDLAAVASRFVGASLQTPPMYSALKRDGVPLYRLARQGLEVERAARPVRIDHLVLARETPGRLRFSLACSKGTYVRVLAEDIGSAFDTAAHLAALRRTGFGGFDISAAVSLPAWDPAQPAGLVSVRQALAHLPAVSLDDKGAEAARQGKAWVLDTIAVGGGDAAVLLAPDDEVVAVVQRSGRTWAYGRVLSGQKRSVALHRSGAVLVTTVK
jgi:tRNA pseudouridine55 synthase